MNEVNLSQANRLVPQYNYRSTLSQPANPLDVWTLADYRGTIRLVFVSTSAEYPFPNMPSLIDTDINLN
jgi:hypothetical protein